jgi:hypothetical protein
MSSHSNLGACLGSFDPVYLTGGLASFFLNLKYIISREEHKTTYCDLRITGMALSNQSELPALFSPRQVNLKISQHILHSPTIPEDDLPILA